MHLDNAARGSGPQAAWPSRRKILTGFIVLPIAAHLRAAAPDAKKAKVLVAGGHPGDPEYGCGGTVARYTDLGHEVALVYLNHGQKGCGGASEEACAATRTAEAQHACQILGAQPRFADQADGTAVVDARHYDSFRELIQSENPQLVFTQWPIDNHRDHRATYTLVYDAWQKLGKRFSLYFYEVSDGEDTMMFAPTDYVDITKTEPRKRSACYAHASQSPDRFYALQSQVARFRGTESGYAQAEAFVRHIDSPGGLLL